ncbi:MAG: hypothetical protein WDO70_08650 [Alphaproteobacteria bacterium]
MKKFLACFMLLIAVAACTSEAPTRPIGPFTLDYSKLGKITFAVEKMEFMNRVTPSVDAAYFENFKPQFTDVVYRWGVDRLQAGGGKGRAILVIHDANITREKMHRSTGVNSWFTREQSEKWSAQVAADIRVEGAAGNFNGSATAKASRFTTLLEDATEAEKQGAYRKMITGLMDDLNAELERSIREHLNPAVLTMP